MIQLSFCVPTKNHRSDLTSSIRNTWNNSNSVTDHYSRALTSIMAVSSTSMVIVFDLCDHRVQFFGGMNTGTT